MDYGVKNAFGKLRWGVMHRPYIEFDLLDQPLKWGFTVKPNKEEAAKEFDNLVDILRKEGMKIEFLESMETYTPNLYFTKDLGICTNNGIIIANFKTEFRRGEELFMRVKSEELGIPLFGEIRDAYFEGGDFVRINNENAALGLSRSNYAGYEALRGFIDINLLPIPHRAAGYHLDTLFGMVRNDLAICFKDVLPREFLDFLERSDIRTINISKNEFEKFSCDILLLDDGKVMIGEDCTETINILEGEGIDVITIKIHQLKKGKGGPGSFVFTLLRK